MTQDNKDVACGLAWNLYLSRVKRLLALQKSQLQKGVEAQPSILYPPTLEELGLVEKVIQETYVAGQIDGARSAHESEAEAKAERES